MTSIVLVPLKGAIVGGEVEINLGESKDSIEKALCDALNCYPTGYYDTTECIYSDLELKFCFCSEGKLEYIECVAGPFPEKTKPYIYGKEVFTLPAEDLIELLAMHNSDKRNDSLWLEHVYVFDEISVGIFREMTEIEARQSISDNISLANYELNKDDYERDLLKSKYFWTIGIGIEKYHSKYLQ